MKLNILGCYAATPREETNPTAQVLEVKGHLFLIDCGEGTQVQLRKRKIKFARIKHIFISHLHGDHFFGLIGLISTFRLLGRDADLHIYAPKGAKDVIFHLLKVTESNVNYNLIFHELSSDSSQVVFEDDKVTVSTIPLDHRVYTNGYLFQEKEGERKLDINKVNEYDIETCYFQKLKSGEDVPNINDELVKNEWVTLPPNPPKSYAFCSDTTYQESVIPLVSGVDMLYHESTFLEDKVHLCEKTKHSTAIQAATIAKKADVKSLLLGHYSTRYKDVEMFREEAQTVFENVLLARDGKSFEF